MNILLELIGLTKTWPAELSLEIFEEDDESQLTINNLKNRNFNLSKRKHAKRDNHKTKQHQMKWFSKIDDAWALLYGGTNQFKETQHLKKT